MNVTSKIIIKGMKKEIDDLFNCFVIVIVIIDIVISIVLIIKF